MSRADGLNRVGSSEDATSDVAWNRETDRYVGHSWRKTKWQPTGHCSTRAQREAKRLARIERKKAKNARSA